MKAAKGTSVFCFNSFSANFKNSQQSLENRPAAAPVLLAALLKHLILETRIKLARHYFDCNILSFVSSLHEVRASKIKNQWKRCYI